MKYSVERDARSGRFTTAKITASREVITSAGDEKRGVSNHSIEYAKKAANLSLHDLRRK